MIDARHGREVTAQLVVSVPIVDLDLQLLDLPVHFLQVIEQSRQQRVGQIVACILQHLSHPPGGVVNTVPGARRARNRPVLHLQTVGMWFAHVLRSQINPIGLMDNARSSQTLPLKPATDRKADCTRWNHRSRIWRRVPVWVPGPDSSQALRIT